MKIKFEWEVINKINMLNEGYEYTYRAKVIGGWLVKNEYLDLESDQMPPMVMCFIADPNHEWEIDRSE